MATDYHTILKLNLGDSRRLVCLQDSALAPKEGCIDAGLAMEDDRGASGEDVTRREEEDIHDLGQDVECSMKLEEHVTQHAGLARVPGPSDYKRVLAEVHERVAALWKRTSVLQSHRLAGLERRLK